MDKVDFSILLLPVATSSEEKDIALVAGMASIAQQIQNIVLSNKIERPFAPVVGVDFDTQSIANNFTRTLYNNRIYSSLSYLISGIYNIKSSIQYSGAEITITVTFDYKTKSFNIPNNTVTLIKYKP
jgi:hypothetical protein